MISSQDFIKNFRDPDDLAAEANPRIIERFPNDHTEIEPTELNAHARRQIIRTLRDIQQLLLQAESEKQEANRQWDNAENRVKHLNVTYDEMKAILESL